MLRTTIKHKLTPAVNFSGTNRQSDPLISLQMSMTSSNRVKKLRIDRHPVRPVRPAQVYILVQTVRTTLHLFLLMENYNGKYFSMQLSNCIIPLSPDSVVLPFSRLSFAIASGGSDVAFCQRSRAPMCAFRCLLDSNGVAIERSDGLPHSHVKHVLNA